MILQFYLEVFKPLLLVSSKRNEIAGRIKVGVWVYPYTYSSLGVDAIGDDDDLSHVYLPNFKQL